MTQDTLTDRRTVLATIGTAVTGLLGAGTAAGWGDDTDDGNEFSDAPWNDWDDSDCDNCCLR